MKHLLLFVMFFPHWFLCSLNNKCGVFLFSAEKYFKMKKSDCKESLEIYKKFLNRVTKISEFMKIAEVGQKCFQHTESYIILVLFI